MLTLAIVAGSALGLTALRDRVDRSRQVQTEIREIRLTTTAAVAIDLVAAASPEVGVIMTGEREGNLAALAQSLDRFDSLSGDRANAAAVRTAATRFVNEVAGRAPSANASPFSSTPYFAWFSLDRALAKADVAAERSARAASTTATIGTWAILLVATALIALLAARFGFARNRAQQLAVRASTDSMTGLANHATFHEQLRTEVALADHSGAPLSLVLLDLDHFKGINDHFGHQTGDAVLVEVARRLRGTSRAGDLIGRIGGEEFAWLLVNTNLVAAHTVAAKAVAAVRDEPFDAIGAVTVSAGVATLGKGGDADDLIRAADAALYRAKRGGRDRIVVDDNGAADPGPPAAPRAPQTRSA